MKRWRKIPAWVLCIVMLLSVVATADGTRTAWGSVQDEHAVLYLPGAALESDISCLVGNVRAEVLDKKAISELEQPIETVVLLDNSESIPVGQRSMVEEFLQDLIANRMKGEVFSFATLSKEVSWLCYGESNYTELKQAINSIKYQDQNTRLTDGLYSVLQELSQRNDGILRRIVIVADGADNKRIGITREELHELITEVAYPIYTIGCGTASGANEPLQNLFALSRLTEGESYFLGDKVSSLTIVEGVTKWNDSVWIEIDLPDSVCDGSVKMLQVTAGEDIYTVRLAMPFVEAVPEPEPEPEPEVEDEPEIDREDEEEPDAPAEPQEVIPDWVFYIGFGLLAVIVILIVVLLSMNKRKKEEFLPPPGYGSFDSNGMAAGNARSARTAPPAQVIYPTLLLCDEENPAHQYKVLLNREIRIGRDPSCDIVLDYDKTVARRQCDIYSRNGRIVVRNLSTSNITKVDGQAVNGESELRSGALLKMGHVVMQVEILR